jgi:hypothetical protein
MADKRVSKSAQGIHTDALNVTLKGTNRVQIETTSGQKITIQGDASGVLIQDGSGDSIELQGGSIQIRATAKVSLVCSEIEIDASTIAVNAGTAKFSGVVQADTLVANSVIASTYSPGAGNVW